MQLAELMGLMLKAELPLSIPEKSPDQQEIDALRKRITELENQAQRIQWRLDYIHSRLKPIDAFVSEFQHNLEHASDTAGTPAKVEEILTGRKVDRSVNVPVIDTEDQRMTNAGTFVKTPMVIDQIDELLIPEEWKRVRRALAEIDAMLHSYKSLNQSQSPYIIRAIDAVPLLRKEWAKLERTHCKSDIDVPQELRYDKAIEMYAKCIVHTYENVWLAALERLYYDEKCFFRVREQLSELIGIDKDPIGPYSTIRRALLGLVLHLANAEGQFRDFIRQEPQIRQRIASSRIVWAIAEIKQSMFLHCAPKDFNLVRDDLLWDLIHFFFDVVRDWARKEKYIDLDRIWEQQEIAFGLERFAPDVDEPFDCSLHESYAMVAGDRNTKIERCTRAGYRLVADNRIFRKAMVILVRSET